MSPRRNSNNIHNLVIDENSDLPIWIQIKDRIVYLISSEYYQPDDLLPSVRRVAAENRISYNTVSKAYMALEREGYITIKHGSGAYVRANIENELDTEIDLLAESFINACLAKGMDFEDIPKCINRVVQRMRRDHDS